MSSPARVCVLEFGSIILAGSSGILLGFVWGFLGDPSEVPRGSFGDSSGIPRGFFRDSSGDPSGIPRGFLGGSFGDSSSVPPRWASLGVWGVLRF